MTGARVAVTGDRRRGAAARACGSRAALRLALASLLSTSACLLPRYSVSDVVPGGSGGQGDRGDAGPGGGRGGVTGAGGGGVTGTGGGVTGTGGDGVTGTGGSIDAGGDAPAERGDGDAPPPRCGDRVCSAGETEAGCCEDCGCSGGRFCFSSSCLDPHEVMTWSFDDNCADGRGIQVRLFDLDNNNVWPPNRTSTYHVQSGELDHLQSIPCVLSQTICYGAVPDPDDGVHYWGLGLDGTQPRSAGHCGVCGVDRPGYILSCD
ncbi:MAG TPA: hypothetical protein VFH68_01490 [Polyangia bacterium]|nr:hypothetical protein [Polyangia bacterium]